MLLGAGYTRTRGRFGIWNGWPDTGPQSWPPRRAYDCYRMTTGPTVAETFGEYQP